MGAALGGRRLREARRRHRLQPGEGLLGRSGDGGHRLPRLGLDARPLVDAAEAPVFLYHISGDAGVTLGRVDEGGRVEPKPWKAVAAVPASAEKAFAGLKTMAAASFAQTAAAKGGAHLQL